MGAQNEESNNFKEFCASVSAHGCCHMVKGTAFSRVIWTIVVVAGFCCAVLHLFSITTLYLKYEHYEVVTVKPDVERIFPDVTVCDSVGVSEYAVLKSQELRRTLPYIYSTAEMLRKKKILNYTKEDAGGFWQGLPSVLASMPKEQLTLLGSRFDSLIVDCKINEQKCDRENFDLHVNPGYINCYTFKAKSVRNNHNSFHGPELGLSLILRGETSLNGHYHEFSKTGNIKGIHVDVHPVNTMPFAYERLIDIPPGTSTSFAIRQKMYSRLGAPYSDCERVRNVTIWSKEYLMEPTVCLYQCANDIMRERCNCTSTALGMDGDSGDYCIRVELGGKSNVDASKALCESEVINLLKNNVRKFCKICPWNCEETKYDVKIYQTPWPLPATVDDFITKFVLTKDKENPVRQYYEHLLDTFSRNITEGVNRNNDEQKTLIDMENQFKLRFKDLNETTDWADWEKVTLSPHIPDSLRKSNSVVELQRNWVQESFYRLNVYFSEPYVTMHSQVAVFSFGDFLSGVGGVMGIWAGASILTLLEILSFLGGLVSKTSFKIKPPAGIDSVAK